ncbi:MAG TPA: hypothetical protein P5137_05685 [Candidatus Brocadiia bacterium]|nr:hypothetical protein [Candidatus Brocadiia bacterium]
MSKQKPQPQPAHQCASDRWLSLSSDTIPLKSSALPSQPEDFEVEFLEGVISGNPCDEDSLILLGHLYTRRGELRKGLEMDRRLSRLRPNDPNVFYNLACSHSLLSQLDEAFGALERAVKLGYRDLDHLMSDPDMERVRTDVRFESFCRRMKLLSGSGPNS